MFKQFSIHFVAVLIALVIGLVTVLTIHIFGAEKGFNIHVIGFVVLNVAISYILCRWIIKLFVLSRIRSVYKFISTTKSEKVGVKELKDKSIEEVNEEVMKWAEGTKEELSNLKSLEKYRKDFVGNVSHELKTPIFSIQGYLHTILEGAMYDEKVLKKYLERALANVDRLENIVEDLEVINKVEEEKLTLQLTKFNIYALIDEVIDDLNVQVDDEDSMVKLVNKTNPNILVEADQDAISQVLTNLIVNSIKYGNPNGETVISTDNLINNKVLIEVSDNGIGIAPEHLKHLFDRFYRAEPSRTRQLGGSGLGLSIVKHLMELHGETVNVRSTEGVGSTFGFTLKTVK